MLDSVHVDTIMMKYRMRIISTCQSFSDKLPKDGNVFPGTSDLCGNLSWHLLIIDSFKQAEKYAGLGLQMDSSQLWIKINLAHSLLLQGRYSEAEKEYLSIKEIKDSDGTLFKNEILKDL
jgi:Flp pilus assembly protein TadD